AAWGATGAPCGPSRATPGGRTDCGGRDDLESAQPVANATSPVPAIQTTRAWRVIGPPGSPARRGNTDRACLSPRKPGPIMPRYGRSCSEVWQASGGERRLQHIEALG